MRNPNIHADFGGPPVHNRQTSGRSGEVEKGREEAIHWGRTVLVGDEPKVAAATCRKPPKSLRHRCERAPAKPALAKLDRNLTPMPTVPAG
ncbi:MAG: hypothetical protein ACJAYU_004003 [Bradymonadia bacterium]|jgi:hypothetical protein